MKRQATDNHAIKRHKAACAADRRSRWWRDGLLMLGVGAFIGVIVVFVRGWDPWLTIGAFALGLGVLGAVFGPRVFHFGVDTLT